MSERTAVVIPCYNHARYIAAAVESVLSQTRPPDRFLVIDDGSADESLAILRGFEKDGVEVLSQPNAGAHATLNRAVHLVAEDCDRVAILNSDDLYEPGRLAALGDLLDGPGQDVQVAVTGLQLIDDDGEPLAVDAPRAKWFRAAWSMAERAGASRGISEWLGVANFAVTTSNVFARAKYLVAHPFRDYRFIHDYFLFLETALRGRLAVLPEPLLRYRAHETNTIRTDPAPLMREMLRMNLDLYRVLAPELERDAECRARFSAYARASWDNVSSLDAGILQAALASLVAIVPETEAERVVQAIDAGELDRFPNAALLRHYPGEGPLVAKEDLAARIAELERANAELRDANSALKEVNRTLARLGQSPKVALARLMGMGKDLFANRGKSPSEKLAHLRSAVERHRWLGGAAKQEGSPKTGRATG